MSFPVLILTKYELSYHDDYKNEDKKSIGCLCNRWHSLDPDGLLKFAISGLEVAIPQMLTYAEYLDENMSPFATDIEKAFDVDWENKYVYSSTNELRYGITSLYLERSVLIDVKGDATTGKVDVKVAYVHGLDCDMDEDRTNKLVDAIKSYECMEEEDTVSVLTEDEIEEIIDYASDQETGDDSDIFEILANIKFDDDSIINAGISIRACSILFAAGYDTISKVKELSVDELSDLPRMTPKTLSQIIEKIKK